MKVRMINENAHRQCPEYYPKVGTIGTVVRECEDGALLVKWPEGSLCRPKDEYCTFVDPNSVMDVSGEEYGITIDNIKKYAKKFGIKVDVNLYKHTKFMTEMAHEYARKRMEDYYKALLEDAIDKNGDVNKHIDLLEAMDAAWTTYEEYREIASLIKRELDKVL